MANYFVRDNIAVIEANNQPVNALSHSLRRGIFDGIHKANADSNVKAVVLCGKGRTFPSGADIKEFGQAFRAGPDLREVCDDLENSRKPVVAATHGTVLGGGLEVALGCHYRVALKGTQFGFPEVTLGILPAAAGTQRFPRLVGLEASLRYIPVGDRISVKQAHKLGLVDKIVEKDVLSEAIQFARNIQSKPFDHRRVSKMPIKDSAKAKALGEAALMRAAQKSKGLQAPVFCIKSVLASCDHEFTRGLEIEANLAAQLFTSGQARALQYAFFAQRAATKWSLPGMTNTSSVKALPVHTAAVIGAGTMGTGISMALMNAGIPVILIEQNENFLKKGVKSLEDLYAGSVKLGKLTGDQMNKVMSQLTPTVDYNQIKHVDLVIEAVFENLAIKKEVFKKLDAVCKPSAVLCSNTSYLSIDEIASVTKRPDKVVGTHFFVPAYYMRVLENIRGQHTSPQTIATVMELGKHIGKVPVLVGNCFGFVGNRMQAAYGIEAGFLAEEGASPAEIDEVLENFGMLLGTFKVRDLSGLDIGWRTRQERAKRQGKKLEKTRFVNGERTSYLGDILCEHGRFGRKTGKGWYLYDKPGGKVPMPDPWVDEIIKKYCQDNGIVRRRISTQEITERCCYSLINEGFKILEEGIASKPEDIDTIWLLGYAWPRQTGGPMFYANQVGIPKIYERVCHYYDQHPHSPHWQPSKLLEKVAKNDLPMQQWTSAIHSRL